MTVRNIKTAGLVALAGGAVTLGRALPRIAEVVRAARILDSVDTGSVWTTTSDESDHGQHAVRVGAEDRGPE
jgi:hypothetical protein